MAIWFLQAQYKLMVEVYTYVSCECKSEYFWEYNRYYFVFFHWEINFHEFHARSDFPDFKLKPPDWKTLQVQLISLSFHSKHDKEKQKLCFMFSLTEMPGEFKGLKAATVWPSAYLSPSAAEQQPTSLWRPQGLKRQLWPIYGCLTFFPSRPYYSFPTHLSFPFEGSPPAHP